MPGRGGGGGCAFNCGRGALGGATACAIVSYDCEPHDPRAGLCWKFGRQRLGVLCTLRCVGCWWRRDKGFPCKRCIEPCLHIGAHLYFCVFLSRQYLVQVDLSDEKQKNLVSDYFEEPDEIEGVKLQEAKCFK